MKLSRMEIAVLVLTAVFILSAAGFFLYHRNAGGVFTVETQTAPTAAASAPSPSVQASGSQAGGTAAETAGADALPSGSPAPFAAGDKLDLNTATEAQLESLPGIGPSKAAEIVEYRTKHGPFSSIRDIMKVSGIKEGIFAEIEGYITVN